MRLPVIDIEVSLIPYFPRKNCKNITARASERVLWKSISTLLMASSVLSMIYLILTFIILESLATLSGIANGTRPPLNFRSDFECGNLRTAIQVLLYSRALRCFVMQLSTPAGSSKWVRFDPGFWLQHDASSPVVLLWSVTNRVRRSGTLQYRQLRKKQQPI